MFKQNFILLFLLCFSFATPGFSGGEDQGKIAKKANGYFKKGEYVIAEKFYAQLTSTNPKNVEYNYKYGACLLNTSANKQDALKYLEFAVKNSSEVGEAHFYYARVLQYSYHFKKALKNYNLFRATITVAKADKLEVDARIQQCKTSMKLMEEFSPVKVISSKVMNRQRFEKAYRLGKMKRKVLVKPNDFTTKEDFLVKGADPKLIVHGSEQTTLFFSGYKYGDRFGILERDIYMVKKSDDGIWSNFLDVGPFLNTKFDEDYPYLHPNGKELYFSSKGHGGLGGYDIFKSQLDSITGLWGKPVNLGFAINSAFDDVLYVVDGNNNVAFFSSNRANSSSEMTVYKIIANDKIDNFVLCKGKVTVNGGTSNEVNIEVTNTQGQLIGNFVTNKKTGDFIFPLAELENYRLKFTYDKQVTKSMKLMTPLKSSQDVIYNEIDFTITGQGKLESKTLPNYELSEDEKLSSFQDLAKLDVNQDFDIDFGEPLPPTEKGITDITVVDPEILLKDALLLLEEIQNEKNSLGKQINAGYVLTHSNTKKAVKLKQELQSLTSSVDSDTPQGKEDIQEKQKEYHESIKKIVGTLGFVGNQENYILSKNKEEELVKDYLEQINAARAGSKVDLLEYRKKMAVSKKELASQNENKLVTVSNEIKKLKEERSKVSSEQFKIKSDKALINDAIEFLTTQMNKTKSDKIRADFANQITDLEKAKKAKNPIYSENKEKLAELDTLLKLKEQEILLYGAVDAQSNLASMKRVNYNERVAIAKNAKSAVNKSKFTGQLDQFNVQNVIDGSEEIASSASSEFSGNTYDATDQDLANFLATNLNDANDQKIHDFSAQIFGIEGRPEGDFENDQIDENDQLAANNFREALMMRQEIEKKKKQLAAATDEKVKQSLREEIKILEDHLFKMEFEAMVALSKSNDLRQKEKNSKIEQFFTQDPDMNAGQVAQLYDEATKEWAEVNMLKQRMANNSSMEQKSNISKEIVAKQSSAIKKLVQVDNMLDGVDHIASNDKPKYTNPPVNNFGRNGSGKNDDTYEGVDIRQYGTNSTMRVKKGILITSDIKYNIRTKVPIDIPLGTGVIYKVQVGAFRNKIDPSMFNGITPLSGEDAGNGIIRYTAGIFKSLTGANMAKGKIVDIGYSDAFVVAFINGRRISLSKAESIINSSTPSQQEVYQEQKTEELAALKKAGIKTSDAYISRSSSPNPINKYKSLNVPNPGSISNNYSRPRPSSTGGATRSTNAKGVYYTVQIGVFSIKKTSSDLHGIAPLVTHTNERGLIRYSTGIFRTLSEANQRKSEARAQGADDAYVAVYRDGIRISLEEAQGN